MRASLTGLTLLMLCFVCPATLAAEWDVRWDNYRPIRIDVRQDWANQRMPDGPLRKWEVGGRPFLADGRSLGPINGVTPLQGLIVGLTGVHQLHFLHWGQPGDRPPEYRIFYSDGTRARSVVQPGPHFAYGRWYFDKTVTPGRPDGCQVWTWKNPHPRKSIDWIDVHTHPSVGIYLLALTAETRDRFSEADRTQVQRAATRHQREVHQAARAGRVLDWPSLAESQRPRMLFTRGDLPRLRQRLQDGVPARLLARYRPWAAEGELGGYVNFVVWLDRGETRYLEQMRQHLRKITQELTRGLAAGDSPQMPGRRLAAACFEYDLLASQNLLPPAAASQLRTELAAAMSTLVDPAYWLPAVPRAGMRPDNMAAFLLNGVAAFAVTFPQHPRSQELVQYVRDWFAQMLQASYGRDGGYMESMGYTYAAYWPLLNTAYLLREHGICDLFADPRWQRATRAMATLMVYPDHEAATFDDPFCDLFLSQPPRRMYSVAFGNANFGGAGAYWLYLAAAGFQPHAPQLAAELMWIWDRCGQPLTPGHAPALEFLADAALARRKPPLTSEAFRTVGRVLLRDPEAESYCLFHCGPHGPHHQFDKGSFSLQARGHTLSIDPGVARWTTAKAYDQSLNSWFAHPRAHNTLTFTGADPGPAESGRLIHFQKGRYIDYACGEMRPSSQVPLWRRHLLFLHPDLYLVWDQLDSPLPRQFNYHPLADRVVSLPDRLRIIGRHGIDTDLVALEPADGLSRWQIGEDANTWNSPEVDLWGIPKWLRLPAHAGESYLLLLHPFAAKSQLSTRRLAAGSWEFTLSRQQGTIRLERAAGKTRLVVTYAGEQVTSRSH